MHNTNISLSCRNKVCFADLPNTYIIELTLRSKCLSGYFYVATAPFRPGLPRYRDFTITLRHNTLGRNPLRVAQPDTETAT
jgi:hypothetical protein